MREGEKKRRRVEDKEGTGGRVLRIMRGQEGGNGVYARTPFNPHLLCASEEGDCRRDAGGDVHSSLEKVIHPSLIGLVREE